MIKTLAAAASAATLVLTMALTPISLARAQTPPEADLTAVFQQFVDAVNTGDADGAGALFTEDATWVRGGQCPPGACVGQAAIRGELENNDFANGHRIDIVDIQVSGTTLTARVELRTNGTRAAGIERIIQVFTLEFREDKISALQVSPDLTDPETAAHAGAGRRLPTTGAGPAPAAETSAPIAALLGLLLAGGVLATLAIGMRAARQKR